LNVVCVTLVAVSLCGFAGGLWWPLDLTSHFRPHYMVTSLLVAMALLALRGWRMAVLAGAAAAINAAMIAPMWLPPATPVAGPGLRLMSINLDVNNDRADLVTEVVRAADPDVLILLEVNDRWERELASLQAAYPHGRVHARADGFGLALLARVPIEDLDVVYWGTGAIPSMVGEVSTADGDSLCIVATHPVPPSGGEGSRRRNEHLAEMAEFVADVAGPVVVMGDLNVTPWSPYFRSLVDRAGLRRAGRGIDPTWPDTFAAIGIPIDHCLHTAEVVVIEHDVGGSVGSDHRPLLAEITVTPYGSRTVAERRADAPPPSP
jgi:endonuclease/exonuclease/phosphatase (EEP) superfamily protein YafD